MGKPTHIWHINLLLYELVILVPLACGNSVQLTSKELGDKCVVRSSTNVLCRDIVENSIGIVDHMNVALENTSCSAVSITLKHINFKDSKIPSDWLNNLKCKLKELTVEDCQLNDISKGAFQSATFNGIRTLTIVNSDLPVIKRGTFLGLSRLETLAFRSYTNRYVLEVEESALDGLDSLTILEMKSFKITSGALINLTGKNGVLLPNLVNLDLGYNTIEILPAYAFENAPRLVLLSLQGNSLKHVDVNAFRNNKAIDKLELSKNSLQTLSNGTFSALSQKSKIFLGTNNWNCECTLQWLKDLYLAYESIHKNGPLRCKQGDLFEDVDFCSRSGDNPLHYSTMNCETSSTASSQTVESVHSVKVTIENINFSLKVEELETEPLQVKIIISNLSTRDGHFLMWFKSDNTSANGCVILHDDIVYISNLERNSTYTFNVIRQNETLVSPKATFGLTTRPEWKQRAWILNEGKVPVLGITCFITTLLCMLSAILTYLCIKEHRRVTNATTSTSPIEEMEDVVYERSPYLEPSIIPSSHGYLTPKENKYYKLRYPQFQRSISEWSIRTGSAFYDDYSCGIGNDRSEFRNKTYGNYADMRLRKCDDFKPPLPPPNPR